MKKKLALFTLLLFLLPACKTVTPSPVKTVKWTNHTGAELENAWQLGQGVTCRALIDGSRLYYFGLLKDTNLSTVFCVDLEKGTGRVFKPIPKELSRFAVEGLVPGDNGRIGLIYQTDDNAMVVAVFGPEGWVVEPTLALPAPEKSEESDRKGLYHCAVSGAAWVDGQLEAYLYRGYPSSPFEHQGLHRVVLGAGGEVTNEQLTWPQPEGFDKDKMRLLGSYHEEGKGWIHALSTREKEDNEIWLYGPQETWEKVASDLDIDLRNTLRWVDRTAVNAIGFEAFGGKVGENTLSRWTPPNQLEPVRADRPEGFDPWDKLYRVNGGKLEYVPCLMGEGFIYQKLGETFVTVKREESGTVLNRSDGTSQPVAQGADFPDGSNDFVFLNHGGKLWAVQFNGEHVEIGSISQK